MARSCMNIGAPVGTSVGASSLLSSKKSHAEFSSSSSCSVRPEVLLDPTLARLGRKNRFSTLVLCQREALSFRVARIPNWLQCSVPHRA